jgi:hypothetical protein
VTGDAGLGWPDTLLEPTLEGQVVATAAHQGHRGVGMQIDQARDQQVSWPIDPNRIGIGDDRLIARQDRQDPAALESDRVPLEHLI